MLPIGAVLVIAGTATAADALGYLPYYLVIEALFSVGLCYWLNSLIQKKTWRIYD